MYVREWVYQPYESHHRLPVCWYLISRCLCLTHICDQPMITERINWCRGRRSFILDYGASSISLTADHPLIVTRCIDKNRIPERPNIGFSAYINHSRSLVGWRMCSTRNDPVLTFESFEFPSLLISANRPLFSETLFIDLSIENTLNDYQKPWTGRNWWKRCTSNSGEG